jgi:hypothetical protein
MGVAGSVWAQRKLRRAAERYLPDQMAERVNRSAHRLETAVRDALREGREGMRQRETELRAQLDPTADRVRSGPAPAPQRGPTSGRWPELDAGRPARPSGQLPANRSGQLPARPPR